MIRAIKLGLLLIVVAAAGVGYWGYKNFDEKATEGWSRDVRDRWYRYLDSREERIVLAPDDIELANPYPDVETLTPVHDWFTHKIPSWEIALAEFKGKPNISYLEVGAYEGRSVMWTLDNVLTHPTSRATVIDIFYEMGAEGYDQNLRDRYDANIAHVNGTEKTTTIVGFSQIELRKLPLASYDIIYIDGSHYAPEVLEDYILAMRLLKEDGVFIMDDYRWWVGAPRMKRPKLGADTFLDFYGDQFTVLHNTKQLILKKTSLDQEDRGLVISESEGSKPGD